MKFIKNYKFILFLTFLFIFSSLFSVLYLDQRKLPSDNWSKEIKLETYEVNNRYDNFKTDDNALFKLANHFYLVYFSENSYYLNEYDESFNLIETVNINNNYSLVDHLNTHVIGDEVHLSFTTEGELITLVINTEGDILSEEIIDTEVLHVQYDKNNISYLKENGIYLNGNFIYDAKEIEDFTFEQNNGYLTFAFVEYNLETYKYDLEVFDYKDEIINRKTIREMALDNVTEVFNLDLSIGEEANHLMMITKNIKHNTFTNNYFKLNNDHMIVDESLKYSSGYNFQFLEHSSHYIQNEMTMLGRIDMSSKNTFYPNVALFKANDEVKALTKTKYFPNKVDHYTFENEEYIIFTQNSNGKEISLYLAATDDSIIAKSQHLNFDEAKDVFFNTLTTFLPLAIYGQAYSLLFLVPIFVVILPFSLIKITWAEQNQGKLLFASIALVLLTKSKFILFDMTGQGLPLIFSHPFMRLFIAWVFSGIAIYSMLQISKDSNSHYFRNFFIFFIIDMITFTLFFTPYFLL